MKRNRINTPSGSCDYWQGGEGAPLLLVHGGWAGAEAHWDRVWHSLAAGHSVIAVELPGVWKDFDTAPLSYADHARTCADLLMALRLTDVAVVGNSLGASIGWQLALDRPDLVRHLVMVDGFPPYRLPMRQAFAFPPLRALALRSLVAGFYGPSVFDTAFADPANVPEAIRANFAVSGRAMATAMLRLLRSVTRNADRPAVGLDFVWGERDRLPKVTLADGRALCAANPPARLFPIPDAGHLPQVENPTAFVRAIREILGAGAEGRRADASV
jgi:pimeloyl-ACP methyl ester carboxylesterase